MHRHGIMEAHLALRRAQLALLEIQLVTACEAAAGHGCRGGLPPADRGAWDRATWRRYLAAARALDAELGPRMRRLHAEIERLEHEAAAAASASFPEAA
jgi:hypothetical protein